MAVVDGAVFKGAYGSGMGSLPIVMNFIQVNFYKKLGITQLFYILLQMFAFNFHKSAGRKKTYNWRSFSTLAGRLGLKQLSFFLHFNALSFTLILTDNADLLALNCYWQILVQIPAIRAITGKY